MRRTMIALAIAMALLASGCADYGAEGTIISKERRHGAKQNCVKIEPDDKEAKDFWKCNIADFRWDRIKVGDRIQYGTGIAG